MWRKLWCCNWKFSVTACVWLSSINAGLRLKLKYVFFVINCLLVVCDRRLLLDAHVLDDCIAHSDAHLGIELLLFTPSIPYEESNLNKKKSYKDSPHYGLAHHICASIVIDLGRRAKDACDFLVKWVSAYSRHWAKTGANCIKYVFSFEVATVR